MILTLDIGNTNIHLGLYHNDLLIKFHQWCTKKGLRKKLIKNLFQNNDIKGIAIASVVPALSYEFNKYFKNELHLNPVFVSSKLKMPVKNLYSGLGADRIANIVGGLLRYRENLLIFSFGTALTGDTVLKNGKYLGGIILPGIHAQLESLYKNTAQIKNIKLNPPHKILGTNTTECIQSGIINGMKYAIQGFATTIKKITKKNLRIIATGGGAMMTELISEIEHYDYDLTLYGTLKLYHYNVQK